MHSQYSGVSALVTSIAEVNIAAESGIDGTDADSGVFERQGNPSPNADRSAPRQLGEVLDALLFGPNEGCRLETQSIWVLQVASKRRGAHGTSILNLCP